MDGVGEIRYFLQAMCCLLAFPLILLNRKLRYVRVASLIRLKLSGAISFAIC